MDGSRFDFLAKALHTSPSRRRFFGGLAGVTAAAVTGRVAFDEALAQEPELGATAYDLTCRQGGINSYCYDNGETDDCGPGTLGCRCARTRRGRKRVCIEQPRGGCPTRRTRCLRQEECGQNEECIFVRKCCPRHPAWGVCALRCDERRRDRRDRDDDRRRRRRRRD